MMSADPREFLPLPSHDLQVLLTLLDGPRHAYGVAKAAEAEPAGGVRLEIGSLYRILARLRSVGLIALHDVTPRHGGHEAKRRYYKLTLLGRRTVDAEVARLQAVVRLAQRHRSHAERASR